MRRNVDLRIVNYLKTEDADIKVGRVSNFGSLDLFDNEEIRITFQNQDINDYSKQKISYTKTFNIPATSNNNKLLAFEGLLNNTLEPVQTTVTGGTNNIINILNYPIAVQLWIDDLFIFDGTLLLLSVNKYQNNNSYECIFTTNIYSIIPLLKDQPFNDAYFAKPLNKILQTQTEPIIPANWIWDSIIFENFNFTGNTVSSQKKQILPSVNSFSAQTGIYPIYNDRSLTGLTNHIINSWEGNAKTHKAFWGYIDDGKLKYNDVDVNKPDRVNLQTNNSLTTRFNPPINEIDNIGLLTSKALSYSGDFKVINNSFNLFETIKPYYYVGDVFRKILRWLEYRLNGEYFNYTNLNNVSTINYTNYDNPEIVYNNIPIKFDFDSDILSTYNTGTTKPLDHLILFTPENTDYTNKNINYILDVKPANNTGTIRITDNIDVIFDFKKFPIINYPSIINEEPTLSWDKYGIAFFETSFSITNYTVSDRTYDFTFAVKYGGYDIFQTGAIGVNIGGNVTQPYNYKRWYGIKPYSEISGNTYIISNLPSGYTSSNYVNLEDSFKLFSGLTSGVTDTIAINNWKHSFINFNNYILNKLNPPDLILSTARNNDIFTAYDLRRYLYPSMSDISMGDFIQDIFKLFNIRYEEPNFQSNINNIQLKSYNEYYKDIYNKNGVIDLTNKVDIEKIKVKQLLFDDITFKYGEQSSSLTDYYKNNNQYNLNYGENKVFIDTFRKVNKSLTIETKLGNCVLKPLILTEENRDYNRNNFNNINDGFFDVLVNAVDFTPIYIPTIYNFDELKNTNLDFNTNINLKPVTQFKPFVLFNNNLGDGFTNISFSTGSNNEAGSLTFKAFNYEESRTISPFGVFPQVYNHFYSEGSLVDVSGTTGNNIRYDLVSDYRTSTAYKKFGVLPIGTIFQRLDAREQYKFNPQYNNVFNDLNNNRLIELEVDFKLTDIINFSFGQIYSLRLNGEYNLYVINKISDYVLNNTKLAKVELLQISNPSTYLRTETI